MDINLWLVSTVFYHAHSTLHFRSCEICHRLRGEYVRDDIYVRISTVCGTWTTSVIQLLSSNLTLSYELSEGVRCRSRDLIHGYLISNPYLSLPCLFFSTRLAFFQLMLAFFVFLPEQNKICLLFIINVKKEYFE